MSLSMSSNNNASHLVFFCLLLLLMILWSVDGSCAPEKCGKIEIPYPFGIKRGCYLDKWYAIDCIKSSKSGEYIPFLSAIGKEVESITLPNNKEFSRRDGIPGLGSINIKNNITSKGCSREGEELHSLLNLTGTPFYFSGERNVLRGVGCDITASLTNVEPNVVGCKSSCGEEYHTPTKDYLAVAKCYADHVVSPSYCNDPSFIYDENGDCNGIRCCQATIHDVFQQVVGVNITSPMGGCKVAFISNNAYISNGSDPKRLHSKGYVTVELAWFFRTTKPSFIRSLGCLNQRTYNSLSFDKISEVSCVCDYSSYLSYAKCACTRGYRGNPFIRGGCTDINECLEKRIDSYLVCGGDPCVNYPGHYKCVSTFTNHRPLAIGLGASFGSLIFAGGIYFLYKFIRKQRRLHLKKKFFKRNGGLLLQQQLTSTADNVEKTKVFSSRELEKATENFSLNRILGQGGQGTVYKGMLADGKIVAVKKSKVVDEDKLEEFINEVVILSQINHRNIVKLLGCCLETNVPLLVYEFIPNGNLFEHLHDESDDYTMATWEIRLRIAVDIAGAISYLHSSASSPIYHRDVKSTNIMLDEKYRAKISDFGTSRSVTVDHTHLTTVVSGTVGYMDPEYFQSSQFTEKSDVYSFGVVLAELITGEKSVSFIRSQENRTLVTYFTLVMKENRLSDIIDARIKDGCNINQVTAVAKIARKCMNLKGRKRPTMREVSMELEMIRSSSRDMQLLEYDSGKEDGEEGALEVNTGVLSWNDEAFTAPASEYIVGTSSSDIEPLFPLKTC